MEKICRYISKFILGEKMSNLSSETQQALRSNNIISEQEVAIMAGDLYVAENVLTKERRMLMTSQISQFITANNITESTSKAQLLKG